MGPFSEPPENALLDFQKNDPLPLARCGWEWGGSFGEGRGMVNNNNFYSVVLIRRPKIYYTNNSNNNNKNRI